MKIHAKLDRQAFHNLSAPSPILFRGLYSSEFYSKKIFLVWAHAQGYWVPLVRTYIVSHTSIISIKTQLRYSNAMPDLTLELTFSLDVCSCFTVSHICLHPPAHSMTNQIYSKEQPRQKRLLSNKDKKERLTAAAAAAGDTDQFLRAAVRIFSPLGFSRLFGSLDLRVASDAKSPFENIGSLAIWPRDDPQV